MATRPPKSATLLEVERLYAEHNPAKLHDVPKLAVKYGEAKLLAMVRKKYGAAAAAPPPAAAAPPAAQSEARREIEALYRQHNPEKLAEVDGLMAKYGEARLLAMVRKKYRPNPENPPPPSTPPPSTPPPVPAELAEPTGRAAAAALREHIKHSGTKDVKTIDRLRRASVSACNRPPSRVLWLMARARLATLSAPLSGDAATSSSKD